MTNTTRYPLSVWREKPPQGSARADSTVSPLFSWSRFRQAGEYLRILTILLLIPAALVVMSGCPWDNSSDDIDTYTVRYDANGATGGTAPANQTKTRGVTLTLATNSGNLERTGHEFAGWNTEADGSGTDYGEGASYEVDAHGTMYARWSGAYAYVSSHGGSPSNSGLSSLEPLNSITDGIALAISTGLSRVCVAQGTYEVSSPIEMAEGVSLYGGYSNDFSTRDPALYETVIDDIRTNAEQWAITIDFGTEITNRTVLSGFTINAPSGSTHQGTMRILGAPVIENNILRGSTGGSDNRVISLSTGSNAVIMNNELILRSAQWSDQGIYVNAFAVIVNNVILSTGGNTSRLITIRGGSGMAVYNNLFICNSASTNYAIHIEIGSTPDIDIRNNIILDGPDSGTTYGLFELSNDRSPSFFQNNNLHGLTNFARLHRNSTTTSVTQIEEVNNPVTMTPTQTGDSISVEMVDAGYFVDPLNGDWRLSAGCPASIRAGGQDLSARFLSLEIPATDKAGDDRGTGAWSIGPYN